MSEIDDVRLDGSEAARDPDLDRDPGWDPHRDRRPGSPWVWIVALVAAAALAVAGWLWLRGRPETAPEAPAEDAAPVLPPEAAAPAVDEEPLDLPPLAASDELVRRLVARLSESPALASWLAGEELVRRFVLVVDNVAVGVLPRKEVPSLAPEERFRAIEPEEGPARIDPASYRRYDPAAAVVASLDSRGTVELYRRLRPLIDEASRENLGYGAEVFDETLRRAILHLLEAPVPAAPPALERRLLSYHYADPRLEELTGAQKQLLRMGPENQRRVQAKLRQLARLLEVPEERIPPERVVR